MCNDIQNIQIKNIKQWVVDIEKGSVVLPMIQRGSVWKPHKVLDMWDTMLRGMPLGAMMSTSVAKGTRVFSLVDRKTIDADEGVTSLLDGQQRSLAILSGWPIFEEQLHRPVVVWVDIDDEPQGEYRFRLIATTRMQPFGYERINMGGVPLSKLTTRDRRLANLVYNSDDKALDIWQLWKSDAYMPWKSRFAVRISELDNLDDPEKFITNKVRQRIDKLKACIESNKIKDYDKETIRAIDANLNSKLKVLELINDDVTKLKSVIENAKNILLAINGLYKIEFPIIPVSDKHIRDGDDIQGDPALAVLFKRVGSGGQELTNGDYIFSVIKHYSPGTHKLVEDLLQDENNNPSTVAALYQQTDLVLAAVRFTLLKLRNSHDAKDLKAKLALADRANLDKKDFAKLVKNEGDFIKHFEEVIRVDGEFSRALRISLNTIAYSTTSFPKGLPEHALPWLIDLNMFDVLLAWVCQADENEINMSNLRMVRFLLWGMLCIVGDKAKASELCIKLLDESKFNHFPDVELMKILIDSDIAHPCPSPDELNMIDGLIKSNDSTGEGEVLCGWSRFQVSGLADSDKFKPEIYKRWWKMRRDYHHPMLLWLQRDYVHSTFGVEPPLAGMLDETPYDFDHILPARYWRDFRGPKGTPEFLHSKTSDDAKSLVGNALGNVRIWSSRENRSDGDSLPHVKLDTKIKLDSSLITLDQPWFASDVNVDDSFLYWTRERTKNFQQAVEKRTFALYRKFYQELAFEDIKIS
jgi:hypothetical protein